MSSDESQTQTELWWECPRCCGETRVRRSSDTPTVRFCVECDWSVDLPDVESVAEQREVRER